MARKKTKMCLVCGKDFLGTEGRFTCSNACRTAMSRMLANGKKPEYWLVVKSRGQKLPLFFCPPKTKEENKTDGLGTKIVYAKVTPNSYDSKKISSVPDEPDIYEATKEMTIFEKMEHNAEIEKKITVEKNKSLSPGMHPRVFKLQQDDIIAELKKQLK